MLRLKEIQRKQAEAKAAAAASPSPATTPGMNAATSATGSVAASPVAPSRGAPAGAADSGPSKSKSATVAEMRAQKDIGEMDPCPGTSVSFPDPDNLMRCIVTVKPPEGLYAGGEFVFTLNIPPSYPFEPPKVHCETLVYHPNIDWEGHVCLNILRQDWMPVLSVGSVIFGLLSLFLEPNADDPLNKEAAEVMTTRPREFERTVRATLRGGSFFGRRFPRIVS